MELPGHVNCQGSGPGQWILGGGSGGARGNSMPRGSKAMEQVQYSLASTTVMVRIGLANIGAMPFSPRDWGDPGHGPNVTDLTQAAGHMILI